jgi:hypothetical protein
MRLGDVTPVRDTNRHPLTGASVTTGQNNPCCDWWRDPLTRSPSPRLGSRFGGAHPAGMVGIMADGSSRTIRWSIDQRVFFNLCHKSDGSALGNF